MVRRLALGLIDTSRSRVSPHLPAACRYDPTCSLYTREAIRRHGVWRGGIAGVRRIAACNPVGGHGWDPVAGSGEADLHAQLGRPHDRPRTPAYFRMSVRDEHARAMAAEDLGIAPATAAPEDPALIALAGDGVIFTVRDSRGKRRVPRALLGRDGLPRTGVPAVTATLLPVLRGWELALWWVTPHPLLDRARPLDRIGRASDRVLVAAESDAAALAGGGKAQEQ